MIEIRHELIYQNPRNEAVKSTLGDAGLRSSTVGGTEMGFPSQRVQVPL